MQFSRLPGHQQALHQAVRFFIQGSVVHLQVGPEFVQQPPRGATVTLTFNENLTAATGLRGSAFTVKKKGGSILGEVLSSEPTVRGRG